ncbi:NADPH dehydrogenase [Spiroplasma chinense]|uniref:NADPH dehydrogenase n=1 Tax=Spiroplasma chinense TaxID=216932 RepID=A0A5B9Y5E9_9MOLU|nr:NAD(P)H-dependent oxidoreductase [Spiroplasma chinense]QEH61919.1 NADPH dehydrogenase [Spiroplasma chinense]
MKTIIVLANPKVDSFNHAIVKSICEGFDQVGEEYEIWDLYKMGFNPVITEKEYQKFGYGELVEEDVKSMYNTLLNDTHRLVIVYPLSHFNMPAILSGFFERVFVGTAISTGDGKLYFKPMLNIEKTVLIQTSLGEKTLSDKGFDLYQKDEVVEISLEKIGLFNIKFYHYTDLIESKEEDRKRFLESIKQRAIEDTIKS